MYYLAFDLDGTIGNFLPIWKLLCPLRQDTHFVNFPNEIIPPISNELKWDLDIAYAAFVKRIVEAETSTRPLGLFRPGIFKVFEEVSKLRKKDIVKGVIMYTNNSSPPLFNFASDALTYHNGGKVFDDILDYRHPLRIKAPHRQLPPTDKRWAELKHLLTESKSKAPTTIQPTDVMFFDDMHHYDLIYILGAHDNYIKVSEYNFVCDYKRLSDIFLAALKDSDVLSSANLDAFLAYASNCVQSRKRLNSVEDLIHLLIFNQDGSPVGGPSTAGPVLNSINLNAETMIAALRKLGISKPNNNVSNNNIKLLKPRKAGTRKRISRKKYNSIKRIFKYY
jgi:hypothetical protein